MINIYKLTREIGLSKGVSAIIAGSSYASLAAPIVISASTADWSNQPYFSALRVAISVPIAVSSCFVSIVLGTSAAMLYKICRESREHNREALKDHGRRTQGNLDDLVN